MNYSKDRKLELLKQRIVSKFSNYEEMVKQHLHSMGLSEYELETELEHHDSWCSDIWEILTHENLTVKELIDAVGEDLFIHFVYDTEQYDLAFKVLDVDFIYWLGESHEFRGLKEHPISGYELKVKELYIKYKSKYPDGLTNGGRFIFPKK